MNTYTIRNIIFLLLLLTISIVRSVQAQCPTIENATFSSTDVTCYGANDGTITVTLGDGAAPFSFQLYDLNQGQYLLSAKKTITGNTVVFSELHGSEFIVNVRKIGCVSAGINVGGLGIPVNEPLELLLNVISHIDITGCFGENTGSFSVKASGGNGGYTYSFEGGAFNSTTSFANLAAGTYAVQAKDAKGCLKDTSVTLTQPDLLTITKDSQADPNCNGNSTGSIVVSVLGGTPAYQYSVNGGAFSTGSGTFSNLLAGSYDIQVKDANGCTASLPTVLLTNPPVLEVALQAKTDVANCYSDATGAIDMTVSGGTAPYTFTWSNGATTEDLVAIQGGTYTVNVTDAKGCAEELSITINRPPQLVVNLTSSANVSCNGAADGSIAVSVSGGTPDYQYSINGSPFLTGSGTFTGLLAGTYNIRAKDSKDCEIQLPDVIITQPEVLTATVASTVNPACNGESTGNITLNTTGGTPAYEYSVNGGAFTTGSGTFTDLSVGTYTIQIKDANGCIFTLNPVVLTQPQPLTITLASQVDPLCAGASDGNVVVTVDGGTPAYTFVLNGTTVTPSASGNQFTFANLTSGAKNIVVRDANGCEKLLAPVTLNEPTIVTASVVSQTNVTGCFGEATGSVTVKGNGGKAGYTYSIDGGAFGGNDTFTGLIAGNYTFQAQDANGCISASVSVTITQPAELMLAVGATNNVTCNGSSTGSISVAASGGTPGYQYAINGGVFGNSSTFSDLPAGSYTIQVKDSQGCVKSITQPLTEPSLLTISVASQNNVTCHSAATGSISVSVSGGVSPYAFSIDGTNFSANSDFANLPAGTYTVTVRDANNCTKTTLPVTLTEPTELVFVLDSTTDVTGCNGDNTGSITVSATGGASAYQYSLNGGAFSASNTFINLAAGTYSVTVRDGNNCTKDLTNLTISQPNPLTISLVNKTDVANCNGETTGSISTNAAGGTLAYTYTINGTNPNATGNFTGLAAGTYTIRVTDSKGCTTELAPVVISQPAALTASVATKTDITCFGSKTGSINLTVSGGTSTYTYSVNGSTFTPSGGSFTGLAAGTYAIVVKDSKGCTVNLPTVTLNEPAQLVVSLTSKTDVQGCNGESTGSIAVSVSGGTPAYQYAVNGGAFATGSGTFSNLPAGTYTIQVKDGTSCTATLPTVTISQPNLLTISLASKTDISGCNGDNTGSITVSATGGTAGYTYALNGGAFTNNAIFTGLLAGTYTAQAKDANGCTVSLNNITLSEPAALSVTLAKTDPGCSGGNTGNITVSVAGGTPDYQYSINGGAFGAGNAFANVSAGTYQITVKDAGNCTTSADVTLTSPSNLVASVTATTDVTCAGDNNGSITVNVSGGTSPYTYALNGGTFQSGTGAFSSLPVGSYDIQVKDNGGCAVTLPTVSITQPATLALAIASQTDINTCTGTIAGSVKVTASGGNGLYEYALDGGAFGPAGTFGNLSAGTHTVQVKDANGCGQQIGVNIQNNTTTLNASFSREQPACNSGNGSITITSVSGGSGSYEYQLNSGSFQASTIFPGLTSGNYTVTIRDLNATACTATLSVTLDNTTTLTATSTNQAPTSCTAANGSITVTANGGSGLYTYFITGVGQASNVFSNLSAGDYTIEVTDGNGCNSILPTITLGSPAGVKITLAEKQDATCSSNSGLIRVTASGGSGSYTYALDGNNFSASNTFSNVAAGTYDKITVKDAGGCTAVLTPVTITQSSAPVLSLTSTQNVGCSSGSNDGEIVTTVSGGIAPYTYSLSGNSFTPGDGTFINLTPGNYDIQVKDANGCTASLPTVTISSSSTVAAEIKTTNLTACGVNDGKIEIINPTGGSGTYRYSLNGTSYQTSPVFSPLPAGKFPVYVRDAANANCVTIYPVTITSPDGITATETVTHETTCGAKDGTIIITASGGSGSYDYYKNGILNTTGNMFTGLEPRSYIIQVRDRNNNCSFIFGGIQIKDNCTPICNVVATATATDVSCFGANDGTITVNASGGEAPYMYSVNNGSYSSTLPSLPAGTYTVRVRDNVNCAFVINNNITIAQPTQLIADVTSINPATCNGTNGSLQVSASGGSGSYEYSKDGTTFSNQNIFSNLVAGTYTIYVRDINGCQVTSTYTLTSPGGIAATFTKQDESCAGNDGSITVTNVSGGSGDYSYSLDGGPAQNQPVFSELTAKSHTVVVTDNVSGCTTTLDVMIAPATSFTASVDDKQEATCNGADGSITVGAIGGMAPYTYSWNTGETTAAISGLAAGDYTVRITDAKGCVAVRTIRISQSGTTAAPVVQTPPAACVNGAVSQLTATGTNIQWYSDAALTTIIGSGSLFTPTIDNTQPGNVTFYATQTENGCTSPATSVTITIEASPDKPIISGNSTVCSGSTVLTSSAATGNQWFRDSNLIGGETGQTLTVSLPGAYTVEVTSTGCTTLSDVVQVSGQSSAPVAQSPAPVCVGSPVPQLTATGTNIQWYSDPGLTTQVGSGNALTPTVDNTVPGNFTFYATQTENGCQSAAIEVTITFTNSLNASVTIAASQTTICAGTSVTFTATPSNGGTTPAYQWQINGTNVAGATNATFTSDALQNNETVTVVMTTGGNNTDCVSGSPATSNSVTMTVKPATDPSCGCSLKAVAQITEVKCLGESNGEAVIFIVSGGSGNYLYKIGSGIFQPSAEFKLLTVGTYTVTVQDITTNCETTTKAKITAQYTVNATIIVNDPTTCGEKGNIRFDNPIGGSEPYSFSVDNGATFQTNPVFGNLLNGTYQTVVKDANGCIYATPIQINEKPAITAKFATTPVSCFGGRDGKITVSEGPTGGANNGYVYSLDGTAYGGASLLSGLAANDYTVFVKDANGSCVQSFPVTITQPARLTLALNNTQPGTCGGTDGSIGGTIGGGIGTYEYKLTTAPHDIFKASVDGTFTISNLGSGTYTLTVRDEKGCAKDTVITLNSSDAVEAKVNQADVTCAGSRDGKIVVTDLKGGSGTYDIYLDGVKQPSAAISELAAGNYIIEVRDANGSCSATYAVQIKDATLVAANVTVGRQPSSCSANDGEINVTGGSGAYQFSLDSLANYTGFISSHTFGNLPNGAYKVYVRNGNGCYAVYVQKLASPDAVAVGNNVTITNLSCNGAKNGKIDVNPDGKNISGGQLPYQYTLTDASGNNMNQSSALFENLPAGTYTIAVQDAAGCQRTMEVQVTEPQGIEAKVEILSEATCESPTGAVRVSDMAGNPLPDTYRFSLDGVNYKTSGEFAAVPSGANKVYIKDLSQACPVEKTFTIGGPSAIKYQMAKVDIGCEGGNKGSIMISNISGGATAGNPNVIYGVSIDNGASFRYVDASQSQLTFDGLSAGRYQLVIEYGNSCRTATETIQIYSGGIPFGVDVTATTCGSANGSATAIMPDLTKTYFFSLDNLTFQESPLFLDLTAGLYTMYVKETASDPCPKQQAFAVPGPDSLRFTLSRVNCFDIRVMNITGGTEPYKVSLDGGKTFVSGNLFKPNAFFIASRLPSGEYSVVVSDNLGCSTVPVTIKIQDNVRAKVTVAQSLSNEPSGEIKISDIRGGTPPYEISLNGTDWKLVTDATTPVDTVIRGLEEGTYPVFIRDSGGCDQEYAAEVNVRVFTIPNIFTPNQDGVNDVFEIVMKDSYLPPPSTIVTVSNRWGKVVYQSKNYQNNWDGGSLPDGLYYYTVNIAGFGDFNGWVQIWR